MNQKENKFLKVRFWLFLALIVLAPLSKYPSLSLPLFDFSSFRIGLYQILATLFILSCFYGYKNNFIKNAKTVAIGLSLILSSIIVGLFFAIDEARSLLLATSVTMLVLLVFSSWFFVVNFMNPSSLKIIVRYSLYASIFFSLLAIVQFIFNSFSNEDLGILCTNCANTVFGFPRINLFAAEPQFLANSLIPFFFISLFTYIKKNKKILPLISLALVTITIGLTFSRGAFLAIAIGLIFFVFSNLSFVKQHLKITIVSFWVIILGFIVSLSMLVTSASLNYKNTPNIAYETTSTIIEQLTLGVLKLPEKVAIIPSTPAEDNQVDFVSPGLIEASTNERLSAAQLALKAWQNSPKNIIFGTGIGNLGPFVDKYIEPTAPDNLTVYIFYILVLSEIGLVGLIGLLIILVYPLIILLRKSYQYKTPGLQVVIAIMASFIAQYAFFGSYINVVYIWLYIGIATALSGMSQKQLSKLLK